MNPEVRKLRKAMRRGGTLPLSDTYTKGVSDGRPVVQRTASGGVVFGETPGAARDSVVQSSDDLLVQMEDAVKAYNDVRSQGQPTNEAMVAFDAMADHVRRAAIEAGDPEGGAVIADVAYALLRLPPPERQLILDRAGRPEIFEPLANQPLAPVPRGGVGTPAQAAAARGNLARARVDAQKKADAPMSRANMPMSMRPSNVFVEPDYYTDSGKPVLSAQTHKNYKVDTFSPLDVAKKRGNRGGSGGLTDDDINTWGMVEDGPGNQAKALRQLAGDQNAQLKQIEKKKLPPTLPQVVPDKGEPREAVKAVVQEQIGKLPRGVGGMSALYSALLPNPDLSKPRIARAREWVETLPRQQQQALFDAASPPPPPQSDAVMTLGASQTSDRWSKKPDAGSTDWTVDSRNRSQKDKMVEGLYRLSDSIVAETAGRGKGAPMRLVQGTDATIDMDQWFGWVRARYPEVDADGNYSYPSKQLNPRWVAGVIQGMYGIDDPAFVSRVEPLIARSLENMPAQPAEGSPGARHYGKALLTSPRMEEIMKMGAGTGDFPEPVYSDVAFPQPPAEKPLRTFAEQRAAAAPADQPTGSPMDRIRALRDKVEAMPAAPEPTAAPGPAQTDPNSPLERLKRLQQSIQRPGTTDQSSIYTVPPASPTRSLLV